MAIALVNNLEIEGYDVRWAQDGAAGLSQARDWDPQLIVLDLTLPELDGCRVLRTLREEGRRTPVLVLSGLHEEGDKIRGFRLGADDYVTKPFSLMELLARIQALLRRAGNPGATADATERFGDVEFNTRTRVVTKAGQSVDLTPRAFDLLIALAHANGDIVSRLDLLTRVWGHKAAVLTRTVDAHVAELRRKLEDDPADPRHILTARKAGYRLRS